MGGLSIERRHTIKELSLLYGVSRDTIERAIKKLWFGKMKIGLANDTCR